VWKPQVPGYLVPIISVCPPRAGLAFGVVRSSLGGPTREKIQIPIQM
jgi:hypothetical protein